MRSVLGYLAAATGTSGAALTYASFIDAATPVVKFYTLVVGAVTGTAFCFMACGRAVRHAKSNRRQATSDAAALLENDRLEAERQRLELEKERHEKLDAVLAELRLRNPVGPTGGKQ